MQRLVSIVIPAHNEEDNVPLMCAAVSDVFAPLAGSYDYELIFVNDGSTDSTWAAVKAAAFQNPRVRGVNFSRNFGNQYALEAGLRRALGEVIVTMDGDMQHPPDLIPVLLEHYEAGYEIVTTSRIRYHKASLLKRGTSWLFYRVFNFISDMPVDPSACDFALLSRRVVDTLNAIDESERFYRGLVNWVGFPRATVPFVPNDRINGTTSFTLSKLIALTWTAVTSFSTFPMKAIVILGAGMTGVAVLLLMAMTYVRFIIGSDYFSQMAFLVMFIIASNGLTLIAIGITAMYLLRIHREVQKRPNFIVGETINLE